MLRVHSLRPNTMRGHMTLYKAALHDDANTLPMWLQETVASYVSDPERLRLFAMQTTGRTPAT